MTANPGPDGSPVPVVARSSRGPSAGLVVIAVTAAVAGAIGLAAFASPSPRASQAPVSAAPSAAVIASPTAGPASPAPTPGPEATPLVIVLRSVADPPAAIGAMLGCKRIAASLDHVEPVVAGADVDAAVASAGRDTGWLYVPAGSPTPQRVWLGEDLVSLARAAGVTLVTVGADGTVWLGGGSGSTRWEPWTTPAGRTAWLMTADEVTGAGACGPAMTNVFATGTRSLTCAGVPMPDCLTFAIEARFAPAPTTGDLDVVVARPECASGVRCPSSAPVVVVVASGGSGVGDVRSAVAIAPVPGVATRTLVPAAIPAYALDAIGRPSLPLPTQGSNGPAADCSQSLSGDLHGAPWDPRVAWIGTLAIAWPAGSTARFAPDLELTVRDGPGLRAGQAVVVTGSLDRTGRAFVACSVAAVPGPGTPPVPGPGVSPVPTPGVSAPPAP